LSLKHKSWGAVLAALLCGTAAAGGEAERIVVPIAETGPVLDGDMGEAFWQKAGVTRRFVGSGTGRPSEPPSFAKVATGPKALFVAFVCLEGVEGEPFLIELDPRVAFGAGESADEPADRADDPEQKPPLSRAYRRIRVTARLDGQSEVQGAGPKAVAAAKALPGGMTVEVRLPYEAITGSDLVPRRGDLWAANLRRGLGEKETAWMRPTEKGPPPGDWVFGEANFIANGDAEEWAKRAPVGWTLTNRIGEKETAAVAFRETDIVVGGSRAVRVRYRDRLAVRPSARIPLRPGANYCLSALLLFRPAPGTKVTPTFSAAPSKTRAFDAPDEVVRVRMPFRAEAPHVEPALIVEGMGGVVFIDDFRLEMVRP